MERRNVHDYEVTREEEVDRKKKPDIRLRHSAYSGHPVTIEIKITDNCTYADLKNALHQQLVKQYLRPQKSRHGILLLCRQKKQKWKINGKFVGFRTLLIALQKEADMVVLNDEDVDALDVFKIDFH